MTSPVPPEWAPHRCLWLGWPSHPELWEDNLEPARAEVAALAKALAGPGRERVRLLVSGVEAARAAAAALGESVEIVVGRFGDIWLRDTGPIFLGPGACAAFAFNFWGGKYDLPGDETVADQIGEAEGVAPRRHDFVLEGGALDHDGAGAVLTTRQCLLNPNRNAGWTAARAEDALRESLGARRVVWLGEGLLNDHTDGHVDNLARFVGENHAVCPMAFGLDDPNARQYDAAAQALAEAGVRVTRFPSPGRIVGPEGEIVPASHMNFIIANGAVIVPVYADLPGRIAVEALSELFPDREVIALPSTALLTGGGSFHCITQQVPA
jgi:agmatine deiminase